MSETKGIRLFIGVSLSMRSLRAVANAASDLKTRSSSLDLDIRWVAPARYHVTLKYLGWTKEPIVPALCDGVAQSVAGVSPFEMRCRDLGGFPSLEKTQVLWAGIDDRMGEVKALAKKVGGAAEALGFGEETRAFHPHVTMARIQAAKNSPPNLVKLTQEAPAHVFSKTLVDHLILYKSSVESDASEYEKIATWSLK